MTMTGRLIEQTEQGTWDESLIDARSGELIDSLLRTWPVPVGHVGVVIDPQSKAGDWIEVKHLLEAGLLSPSDVLIATHRDFPGATALVLENGQLEVAGKRHATPSAAAKALRLRATNGWYFWGLGDGRRLRDVRAEFIAGRQSTDSAV